MKNQTQTRHRKFTAAGQKYFTRDSATEGIALGDFIILAQDKAADSAQKVFYRIPVDGIDSAFAAAIADDNNLYEILPPDMPVKPYFDCEMEIPDASHDDFIELINDFIVWITEEIRAVFGVKLLAADVITLDSCREGKLSFHILIQNNFCFANVADHKIFIKYLMQRFDTPVDDAERALFTSLHWMFKGKAGVETPRRIFDDIPYGSYQNIRLVNQSKKGKAHLLRNISDARDMDTYVRLYSGIGDRVVADMSRVVLTGVEATKRMATITAERRAADPRGAEPIGFIATGMTLMERNNLTYKTLRSTIKPLWKQFLYLIPNTDQTFEFYRNVAFAIRGAGGDCADFEAWAALYAHYDTTKCVAMDFSKFRTDGARTFGRGFLRRYAKIAHPEYFDDGDALLDEYFAPDYSGIEIIRESCQFLSMEGTEFENDIFRPEHIIVMDAYMGRGKTSAIHRMAVQYSSVLYLAPRVAFAKFMAAETGSAIYLDGDFTANHLVCSMESLHKLAGRGDPYEFVVIDEVEANLSAFSSTTMHGKQMETFNVFMRIIQGAKKVVMASAFITNKTLNFVRTIGLPAVAIINDTPPPARRAIQTTNFVPDFVAAARAGKKLYGVFAARSHMETTINDLCTPKGLSRDDILAYSSRVDDEVYDTLDNITETWGAAKAVLATPSITVGNSYSPARPPDFHQVWMMAMPTCICADLFQSHMRVRHLKDNELHFGFPSKQTLTLFSNMAAIDFTTLAEFDLSTAEKLATVVESLMKLKATRDDGGVKLPGHIIDAALHSLTTGYVNTPVALREIHMQNLFEAALSRKHFRAMYMRFLVKCGYTITLAAGDSADIFTGESWNDYYTTLPIYTEEDVVRVRGLIAKKKATSAEKMAVERFFFDKMIDPDADMEARIRHFGEYLTGHGRHHFLRAHMEMQGIDRAVWRMDELRPDGAEFLDTSMAKLQRIKEINALLDISHSWDVNYISAEDIAGCVDYLTENRASLCRCFGIRDWQKTEKRLTVAKARTLLSKIYTNWSGAKIKGMLTEKIITLSRFVAFQQIFRLPVVNNARVAITQPPAEYTDVEVWNQQEDPLGADIKIVAGICTAEIRVFSEAQDDITDWLRADLWRLVDEIGV